MTYVLSPREAAEAKWCCSVNTSGHQGCNIPMDLHLEHLNRRLKIMMGNMGSSINDSSVKLAGESIGTVHNICKHLEREGSDCKTSSDKHAIPSFQKDYKSILSVLKEQSVFDGKRRQQHVSFKFEHNLLQQSSKYASLVKWIKSTTTTLVDK